MSKVKSQQTKISLDIDHIAKLANLPLTTSEKELYEKQLLKILEYVDQIEKTANTSTAEPTFNVSSNTNVMRKDTVGNSLTQEEALHNGSIIENNQFSTKGVFENE